MPPVIVTQPVSRTVGPGASITFSVEANSTVALSYQWQKDGVSFSEYDAKKATLTLDNVRTDHNGTYSVIVSNSAGSVTSNEAVLNVDTSIRVPGTLRWSFLTGGSVYSSPAIGADGTIYVGSIDKKVYALEANGTKRWEFETGGAVYSSPAIGADGTIYIGSDDNKVYALEANGTKRWEFETGDDVYSSPAIGADGTIYIGSDDNKVYALNPDGTKKWEFETGDDVCSSPAIGADGTVYIGSNDNKVYALDGFTGLKKWEYVTGGDVLSAPAIDGDTVYIGSSNKYVYALNGGTGALKWQFYSSGSLRGAAVGIDGTIYFGAGKTGETNAQDFWVYALNPDGTKKWMSGAGKSVSSIPAIGSDGILYIQSEDKRLYALDANGTKKWDYYAGDYRANAPLSSSPAIGPDGTVYFGTYSGRIYALNISSPGLSGPWPEFHQNNQNTGRNGNSDSLSYGLTAHYPFEGNATDQSGHANHGVVYGATLTSDQNGTAAHAYQFDGTNDYISAPDGALKSNRFTISAWMKLSDYTSGVVAGKYNNGFIWYDRIGQSMRFEFRNASNTAWYGVAGNKWKPELNKWYHITGTYGGSGTTLRLYANGVLIRESGIKTQDPLITDEIFTVGRWGTVSDRYFNGSVNEVRTYQRALTIAEIGQLYAMGSPDSDGDGLTDAHEQGIGRYKIIRGNFTWHEAKAAAISAGGHLATITSAAEQKFLKSNLLEDYSGTLWAGATDMEIEGVWKWVTGDPVDYKNWHPGQPDNGGSAKSEHYLYIQANRWSDANNTDVNVGSGTGNLNNVKGYLWETGYFTNPDNPDTDGDGINDGVEIANGTNPEVPQSPPVITGHPVNRSAVAGGSVTFTVATLRATAYQWRKNGVNIPGATSQTHTILNAQPSHETNYSVVVSNPWDSATSNNGNLKLVTE